MTPNYRIQYVGAPKPLKILPKDKGIVQFPIQKQKILKEIGIKGIVPRNASSLGTEITTDFPGC